MLELKEFIVNANKLFTIPDVCLSLTQLVEQPNCTIEDIAMLTSHDPALSARVLRLANTPIYSRRGKIDCVEQAVLKIGTDELCNIAIATTAALVFKGVGESRINLDEYWRHSVYSGILAKSLYKHCVGKRNGMMFTAGILHNIGLLVVLERLPYLVIDLNDVIGVNRRPANFEKSKLGFSLSEVSSELLHHWQLSAELVDLVGNQHLPNKNNTANDAHFTLHCAIKIADFLLSDQSTELEQILDTHQINRLQLSQQSFEKMLEQAQESVSTVLDIIYR